MVDLDPLVYTVFIDRRTGASEVTVNGVAVPGVERVDLTRRRPDEVDIRRYQYPAREWDSWHAALVLHVDLAADPQWTAEVTSLAVKQKPLVEDHHVPEIARRSDGSWGVFCSACSHTAGDYVYPCKRGWDERDLPPAWLA